VELPKRKQGHKEKGPSHNNKDLPAWKRGRKHGKILDPNRPCDQSTHGLKRERKCHRLHHKKFTGKRIHGWVSRWDRTKK